MSGSGALREVRLARRNEARGPDEGEEGVAGPVDVEDEARFRRSLDDDEEEIPFVVAEDLEAPVLLLLPLLLLLLEVPLL